MLERFLEYSEKQQLFKEGERILLAFSGGIDSVAMTELFHMAGIKFGLAHCNFMLRGEESEEDEKFASRIAEKYGVELLTKRFLTEKHGQNRRISIQQAARELRYTWFSEILQGKKYSLCATAHHLNDSIETMMINFLRGSGIAGLSGIKPVSGKFIRPLLFAKRAEIADFVSERGLRYREDSSNLSDKYIRNKIRHHIIPLFQEINPGFEATAARNLDYLRDVGNVFMEYAADKRKELLTEENGMHKISIKDLAQSPGSQALLYEILRGFGFNSSIVADVFEALEGPPGRQFFSPTHRLVKDREYLIIIQSEEGEKNIYSVYPGENKDLPLKLNVSFTERVNIPELSAHGSVEYFDADTLKFPLTLRKWRKGDYFYPLGLGKKKKLSDFYIDKKLSIPEKEKTWLLLSGEEIVWVVGYRIDHRFRVGENTGNICIIEFGKNQD
jgi:tRNA(Ile)-lysidine synthase